MAESITGFRPRDMDEPAPTTIKDTRAIFELIIVLPDK